MERCEHYTLDCQAEKMGCEGCGYYKKSADEMFEELGYEKYRDKDICKYEYDKAGLKMVIKFNLKYKTITMSMYDKDEQRSYPPETTMQELKAINKKVEELGWK